MSNYIVRDAGDKIEIEHSPSQTMLVVNKSVPLENIEHAMISTFHPGLKDAVLKIVEIICTQENIQ